ncbi:ABC transporter permease subunit [Halorientalis pallida]|uniref:ABC transporter permease n=1 Tax=Halorientalis pallida TaxID=2479928 RepID=A0A498KSQ5_9EURY|nr:ABC transporter permease subunit [Halorientalis pallida]RXK47456.1 ABC transporter permease [Halorientalis pallida]
MSWDVIARQDWALTVGERSTKGLLGLLGFVIVVTAYVYPVSGPGPHTTGRFAGAVHGSLTTLVPIVGVLLGYNAVVSERESGALRLSLSLPHSRADVVFGKFLGRVGVVTATLVASLAVAGFLVVYPFGELEAFRYLAFVGFTVWFGGVWTGIGIATSIAAATKRRALVLALFVFFVFVMVWDTVDSGVTLALNFVGLVDGALPDPLQFYFGLEPGRVFGRLTDGFVDPSATVDGAWYLSEWVALVLFVLWLVGPLGLAYRRFARGDLS